MASNLTSVLGLTTTIIPELIHKVGKMTFSWYDYILFSLMLSLSALIGVYFGCFGSKQSTADEYLMGGKKMKVFPISMSLIAGHISGITLLAVPADVYRFGAAYWLLCPAVIMVSLITIYVYLPVFYKLQITSTYEYLERRFDNKTRLFASFLFALSLLLYLPIVIYIPALAFSAATEINTHLITPVVCGICIFYTTIGGLKAVVWTDTLQFTVTIGAVVTVFILGLKSAGGFWTVWSDALAGDRLDLFDFDPDPTKRDSFWIVLIGISVGWLSMVGINQSCVQKYLSIPTLTQAKLSVVYFSFGIMVISSFSVFTGLIMYSKYKACDPFTTGMVTRNDQLLPYYIMDVASEVPGLSGLFIAGVFCAALSTLSASLNCLAGTIYEDFVIKWMKNPSEKAAGFVLKMIVVVVGVVCVLLVFIIEHLGGILPLAFSLGGMTAGPLLGMFTLGVLFPKASSKGAFWGSLIALTFVGWIVVMAQYYKGLGLFAYEAKPTSTDGCNATTTTLAPFSNVTTLASSIYANSTDFANIAPMREEPKFKPFFLFRVSYYYYTPMGALISMIVGLLISYFSKNDDPPVHRDLISPVAHFLLPKEDQKLRKDVDYYSVEKALHIVTTDHDKEKDLNY